jgi:hypothetical protein
MRKVDRPDVLLTGGDAFLQALACCWHDLPLVLRIGAIKIRHPHKIWAAPQGYRKLLSGKR